MVIAFGEGAACFYPISKNREATIDEERKTGRGRSGSFEKVEEIGIGGLNTDIRWPCGRSLTFISFS